MNADCLNLQLRMTIQQQSTYIAFQRLC